MKNPAGKAGPIIVKGSEPMIDSFGRSIDYMRVSITDRCNLRCVYCVPGEFAFTPHADILRYEELLRVCKIAAKNGIRTIKVTGGEPLVRKGCLKFIKELKAIPGIQHVTLTTNGVLLEPYVDALAELRLDGLNISLDTLEPDTYMRMTGLDTFKPVWRSLARALDAGLRVKINCVPILGLNEKDIIPISRLAESFPVDVRFIELMPVGKGGSLRGIPSVTVMEALSGEYSDLSPDPSQHGFGPARYFRSGRLKGSVGFIDAISNHFCSCCNRLRLTSEGFLKLCLYHGCGLDLRRMLRNGASDSNIDEAMARAVNLKPERHSFGDQASPEEGIKVMSQIGG